MTNDVDVVVVGAGPVGLALGGELHRRGVRARIVDKLPAPSALSRAIGVHARTLEIFEDLGIADELIARGMRVAGATMRAGAHEILSVDFGALETRFPFILCVSQVETEAVLAALLERRGGAVERGRELVSLAQDAEGVDVELRTPAGTERVRARWVVGCDGAHSTVRHAVGAAFEGHAYEDTFVLADVHMAWDAAGDRVHTFFAADGIAACFPLPGGRWRIVATASALPEQPTLEDVRAIVEPRLAIPVVLSEPRWISPFRIHCRQVASYRHGRVFLAGDAAHIHSPVGGQGMNTGIQDAHNLAWKLALAARGRGDVLDSYHAERHAVGRHVVEQTDFATRVGTLKGVLAPIRNQVMRFVSAFEPVRRYIARDASELAVGYEDSPIVGEYTSSAFGARFGRVEAEESPTFGSRRAFASGPKPGTRAPDGEVVIDGRTARLAELGRGDAFTLLLFDGRAATAEGYDALVAIARQTRARWGELVRIHVVVRADVRPSALPADVDVILDRGELEDRYGAASECLYLVRPDLYIGFRSQPAHGEALDAYLSELLG